MKTGNVLYFAYRQEPPPIPPTLVTCPACGAVYEGWLYSWLAPRSRWPDENGWSPPRHDWCDRCVKNYWEHYWDNWTPTPPEYI